ncbi:hypothetical protein [Allorhizobium borbori]|uniref:Uncharacterized protein n=1 Tax=Allorhizobium borbori TaxID=485907 RepID=A0A7W6K3L5_9HYPH|nr:hypothetical protein [Allorhizobium borbori]MBB4103636.1 hypothetical protein [Allorhizobium borbori]
MISTTLDTHASTLSLAGNGQRKKVVASAKQATAPRNWTLLLVFLVSPLIMMASAACILATMLG